MKYGLSDKTIDLINAVFSKHPEVETAILYGSRAKGNFHTGSDIDLTLTGTNLTLSILHKIEDEIDDLLLPYKVDLSILQDIENKELLDHIQRVGKVFYSKKT
ncbi:MAG: hypothetical protein KatS3mg027_0047 [Bacteroidia bacterium]|nr:MAG: hypothetical protein KatS3mg027_0047 [Bacteroidia bacterium]